MIVRDQHETRTLFKFNIKLLSFVLSTMSFMYGSMTRWLLCNGRAREGLLLRNVTELSRRNSRMLSHESRSQNRDPNPWFHECEAWLSPLDHVRPRAVGFHLGMQPCCTRNMWRAWLLVLANRGYAHTADKGVFWSRDGSVHQSSLFAYSLVLFIDTISSSDCIGRTTG
jgi:hypothetical protein